MSVWNWIKHVISDTTGGPEPIAIGLEQNPDAIVERSLHAEPTAPVYRFVVALNGGFGDRAARVPVYRRDNPAPHPILKEIYSCELAGKRLEAANVHALREKATSQLELIAPSRSLPLCYFRAPRFDYSLAVFVDGSRLVCPVLAGPRIRAADLAGVREPVCRHLRSAGYLGEDEEPELLVMRPSDLRLIPPAAVVRSLDDTSFWLPTVEGRSPDGPVIGLLTPVAALRDGERRRRPDGADRVPPSGPEATAILRYLGHELSASGRIDDPWALYAERVLPSVWARTEGLTDPTRRVLAADLGDHGRLEVPVMQAAGGEVLAGLEDGTISVFLSPDDEALARAVGRRLAADGFLDSAEEVGVESLPQIEARRAAPGDPEAGREQRAADITI